MTLIHRRDFLRSAIACAAGGALLTGHPADALAARAPAVDVEELGNGLFLLRGAANVVAYAGPEGLLLVDGGPKPQSAALLKAAMKATGARQLHTLFNTHWHPEQTGLNEQAGKSGARIIAHENTRLWLKRRINTDWLPPQGFGPLPEKAIPNRSFYSKETERFGDEDLLFGHLGQAHTDGDIYVHFRKANVLVAGGVVSNQGWPVMDWQTGGWIGGLVGAYDRLIKVCDDGTRIVPANGAPIDLAELKSQREMYMTIYERVVDSLTKGLGPDEAYEQGPAKEFEARWGDSKEFVIDSFKSLWGHFAPDA